MKCHLAQHYKGLGNVSPGSVLPRMMAAGLSSQPQPMQNEPPTIGPSSQSEPPRIAHTLQTERPPMPPSPVTSPCREPENDTEEGNC